MTWRAEDPQGDESRKIKWEVVPYTVGRGLDIGSGPRKIFEHFISVDNCHHSKFGWLIRPDVEADAQKIDMFASASMDFVFSSHLLEHIDDTAKTLKEWWRVIKPGGYLVLYLPHKNFYPNVGQPHANQDHKHDFLPDDIIGLMKDFGSWDLVRNEDRNEDKEYSFFQVYKKNAAWQNYKDDDTSHKYRYSYKDPKPEKSVGVVRYGAFGDLIQTSAILAGFKSQGYHVTLYTSDPGFQAVKHDPNIDRVLLQGKDQVRNEELIEFWDNEAKKYDKWVNLSESVEGNWLAMPGRSNHRWPQHLRHKHLNVNYLQFMNELAGLPLKPENQRFHPTDAERVWAKQQRAKMHGPVIVWSMAGSAVHKTWPYLDQVIARLMLASRNIQVVLVGGPECVMLESGWENEIRVHRRSGIWTIRESLAFLEFADLIIGPETGVLNAAAMLPIPKIITLSHSSLENLTRDWINTVSLQPASTDCYPCHQLHYGFEHCRKDETTGVAACQADISPDQLYESVLSCLAPAQSRTA